MGCKGRAMKGREERIVGGFRVNTGGDGKSGNWE